MKVREVSVPENVGSSGSNFKVEKESFAHRSDEKMKENTKHPKTKRVENDYHGSSLRKSKNGVTMN